MVGDSRDGISVEYMKKQPEPHIKFSRYIFMKTEINIHKRSEEFRYRNNRITEK